MAVSLGLRESTDKMIEQRWLFMPPFGTSIVVVGLLIMLFGVLGEGMALEIGLVVYLFGVVVTGGAILYTHWLWLDPAISLVISAVIVWGTWSLLREALALALAAVPAGVDKGGVADYLAGLPGVTDVHDLHIWGMSTTETALTAHLVRPGADVDDALLARTCAELKARFSIHHATLQIEGGNADHPCDLADHAVV